VKALECHICGRSNNDPHPAGCNPYQAYLRMYFFPVNIKMHLTLTTGSSRQTTFVKSILQTQN